MQHSSSTQFAPLDREAFQSFYRENLRQIYRYVYSKVGNREEAEDLTSQIFIKAVRSLDRERNPQSTGISDLSLLYEFMLLVSIEILPPF